VSTRAGDAGDKAEEELEGIEKILHVGETVLYVFAAAVLLVGAVATLGSIGYHLVRELGDGVEHAVAEALDGLLLVFILLELLAAIRQIMDEHRLVAEPFLIVGMLASIKEIVVLALVAQEELGKPGQEFENAMTEIGVLAGVILLLAIAMYLVRRKEREPEEEQDHPEPPLDRAHGESAQKEPAQKEPAQKESA
jgi:uncharacterized membrane protein (DUF373 family)